MSLKYKDIEMADQGFDALREGLLQNRILKQRDKLATQALDQRAQSAGDLDAYRQAMIDEKMKSTDWSQDPNNPLNKQRDAAADASTAKADATNSGKKATFKWKSGGVEHTAFGSQDFGAQIQQFPADAEKGQHALTISGTTKSGSKVEQTIYATPDQLKDPEAMKDFAQQVKDFQDSYGIVPDSSTSTTTETGKVDDTGKPLPPVTTTRTTTKGDGVPQRTIGDSGLPDLSGVPVSAVPAPKPAARPMATPTPKDVSYLAAHPEMKAKFEARFGAGSADKYLP